MSDLKPLRVVIVGPSDVAEEMASADRVVQMLTERAARRGFAIRPLDWNKLGPKLSSEGIQEGIERDLRIEDADVVVGVFFKKYGTPDGDGYSPTHREIRRAITANRDSGGLRPKLLLYFSTRPFTPTADDLKEYDRILDLRQQVGAEVRYNEYAEPERFDLRVYHDLSDVLDDLTLTDRPWSCIASSTPVLTRNEGFAERVGDIYLTVRGPRKGGASDKVILAVRVQLDTSLSCRVDSDGTALDVTLAGEMDEEVSLGKIKEPQFNVVNFGPLSRTVPDSGFDETFVIQGIRANSASYWPGSGIAASVEVTISDESDAEAASVRSPIIFPALTATSTFFSAVVAKPSKVLYPDSVVHSFVVAFQSAFFGNFKTQQEEAGWRAGGASFGSVFMVSFPDLPKGWEPYATMFDFSYDITGGQAVATKVDIQGLPQGRRSPSTLLWDGRIPMVDVGRGQSAAWEVIEPDVTKEVPKFGFSTYRLREDLVFGIALVGSNQLPPLESLTVWWRRGAAFPPGVATRRPSTTFPIPRFQNLDGPRLLRF